MEEYLNSTRYIVPFRKFFHFGRISSLEKKNDEQKKNVGKNLEEENSRGN